jgi:quercetin dioxygenase-like cupin family protein
MSDKPSERRPTTATNAQEVFSPQGGVRPLNEYLTEVSDDVDYCLMRCTLPKGTVVPMHSHADRETFYVISGKLDAFREDHWETLEPGTIFDVQGGTKHAWRNSSKRDALVICVTTPTMARFLQAISVSAAGSSPEDHARRFLELVQAHGYWLASPEENAAIGLDVNWGDAPRAE